MDGKKMFQLSIDLSYTHSAWQKFTSAHSRNSRRDEADGGGGARVDVPLVLMLIQVGKEPPL